MTQTSLPTFALGAFILLSGLPAITGAPMSNMDVRAVNCNDTGSIYVSSCLETLGLTDWLSGWQAPACGPEDDGANCCEANDNWSTCFLRLAKGEDGFNCTEINNGFCAFDPKLSSTLNAEIVRMVHYVVKNIFSQHVLHPAYESF